MNIFEILLIVFCCTFVLSVTVKGIIDKKKGKNGCGCNCKNCPSKSGCSSNK